MQTNPQGCGGRTNHYTRPGIPAINPPTEGLKEGGRMEETWCTTCGYATLFGECPRCSALGYRREEVWSCRVACPDPECDFKSTWEFSREEFPEGLEAEWSDPKFQELYEPYCPECEFFGNRGVVVKLLSCEPRVKYWSWYEDPESWE